MNFNLTSHLVSRPVQSLVAGCFSCYCNRMKGLIKKKRKMFPNRVTRNCYSSHVVCGNLLVKCLGLLTRFLSQNAAFYSRQGLTATTHYHALLSRLFFWVESVQYKEFLAIGISVTGTPAPDCYGCLFPDASVLPQRPQIPLRNP